MKTLPLALRIRLEQFLLDYLKAGWSIDICSCALCVRARQLQVDIEAEYEYQQDIFDRKDA
jgi:hypothetical protein